MAFLRARGGHPISIASGSVRAMPVPATDDGSKATGGVDGVSMASVSVPGKDGNTIGENAHVLSGDVGTDSVSATTTTTASYASAPEPTTPSWFDPHAFTQPTFDAASYVENVSHFVSMDALRVELLHYQAGLRDLLLNAVNKDYDRFLSLSDGLVDVQAVVSTLEDPVQEFKSSVQATKDEVVALLNDLREGIQKQKEVAEEKATLELMLDANNVASKVERLLDQLGESLLETHESNESTKKNGSENGSGWTWKGADGGGDDEKKTEDENDENSDSIINSFENEIEVDFGTENDLLDDLDALCVVDVSGPDAVQLALAEETGSVGKQTDRKRADRTEKNTNEMERFRERCRLLERVASEANRSRFFQEKGKGLPFIQSLKPRVEKATKQVCDYTAVALTKALESRDSIAVTRCLGAFVELGNENIQTAHELIRAQRVAPAVKKSIEEFTTHGTTHVDFGTLTLECLRTGVKAIDVELAVTSGDPVDGASALNLSSRVSLLADVVLKEVDAAIQVAMPNAYTPGIPDAFLKNVTSASDGIDFLESKIKTKAALALFRQSDVLPQYFKRWNISAYFALRRREILDTFEVDLEDDRLTRAVLDSGDKSTRFQPFHLAATAGTYKTLKKCFEPSIFTPRATDKFTKLAAQILARFGVWVVRGARSAGGENNVTAADNATAGGSDAALSTSEPAAQSWGTTVTDEDLLLLRGDIETLVTRVDGELAPLFLNVVRASLGEAASLAVNEVLQDGTQQLLGDSEEVIAVEGNISQTPARALDRRISSDVIRKSTHALGQLKGITATFRMTNKPLPTKPSHFVSGVLTPLLKFNETVSGKGKITSAATRKALLIEAVNGICEQYADAAEDLLTSVKKTEASLNRLKDRKGDAAQKAQTTDPSQPTDSEKIVRQVRLDAHAFGEGIVKLGIDVSKLESFAKLWGVTGEGEPMTF